MSDSDPKPADPNPADAGISPADVDALLNEMNTAQSAETQAVAQVENATTQVSDIDALLNAATFESAETLPGEQAPSMDVTATNSTPFDAAPDAVSLDLPELQRAMWMLRPAASICCAMLN